MATNRTIRAQRLAQFYNKITPIRTDHGVHSLRSPDQKHTQTTHAPRPHRTCAKCQARSPNCHLTCPRTHDQSKKYITTLSPLLLQLFLPLSSFLHPLARLSQTVPFQTPIRTPHFVSHVTFLSTIILLLITTCRHGSPSSLSRTLTHYAYLLIFLSPISCTILRPIVADHSQAFLVFNLS